MILKKLLLNHLKRFNFFHFRFLLLLLVIIVFFSSLNFAILAEQSQSDSSVPYVHPPYEKCLSNGLNILFLERKNTERIALALAVGSGVSTEGEYMGTGISHLLEHLLFRSDSQSDLRQQIKAVGGSVNASTSIDATIYHAVVAKNQLNLGLSTLCRVFKPGFSVEQVKKEQSIVLKELARREDEPDIRGMRLLFENAFWSQPEHYSVGGDPLLLEKLTYQNVIDYFEKVYYPANATLVIVGNLNSEEVWSAVEQIFGSLPYKKVRPIYNFTQDPSENKSFEKYYSDSHLLEPTMMLAFQFPNRYHPDVNKLELLGNYLAAGKTALLHKYLVEETGLASRVEFNMPAFLRSGLFILCIRYHSGEAEQVKQACFKKITEIIDSGITEDNFKKYKDKYIINSYLELESIESLAESIAQHWQCTGQFIINQCINDMLQIDMKSLQLTAQKYLNPHRCLMITLADQVELQKNIKLIDDNKADRTPVLLQLDNGMKFVLSPDMNSPIVAVQVRMPGGLSRESRGQYGISYVLSDLLIRNDSVKFKCPMLEVFERLGYQMFYGTQLDSLGYSMYGDSLNLSHVLELIKETLNYKDFNSALVHKLCQLEISDEIEHIQNIPERHAELWMRDLLFKDHPYGIYCGDVDSVKKLTPEDIFQFYLKQIDPSHIVISIFGNFNIDHLKKNIKDIFSDIPNQNKIDTQNDVPEIKPLSQSIVQDVAIKDSQQTFVYMGFHAIPFNHPDRYAWHVWDMLESDSASPLFKSIRESLGAAYVVYSNIEMTNIGGYAYFYVATDRNHSDMVVAEIKKEIQRLQQGEITDEELERVKKQIMMEYSKRLENIQSKIGIYTAYAFYGVDIQDLLLYKDKIEVVQREDIQRIANKYLSLDHCVILTAGPEENKKND